MEKHTVRTSHTELTEEVKKTLQGKYHYHTHGVERSRFKILWSAVIHSPNQVGRALQRSRFASGARGLGEHVDSSSKPRWSMVVAVHSFTWLFLRSHWFQNDVEYSHRESIVGPDMHWYTPFSCLRRSFTASATEAGISWNKMVLLLHLCRVSMLYGVVITSWLEWERSGDHFLTRRRDSRNCGPLSSSLQIKWPSVRFRGLVRFSARGLGEQVAISLWFGIVGSLSVSQSRWPFRPWREGLRPRRSLPKEVLCPQ